MQALEVLMFQDTVSKMDYSVINGRFLEENDSMDYKRSIASGEAFGMRSDNYFFFFSGKL